MEACAYHPLLSNQFYRTLNYIYPYLRIVWQCCAVYWQNKLDIASNINKYSLKVMATAYTLTVHASDGEMSGIGGES